MAKKIVKQKKQFNSILLSLSKEALDNLPFGAYIISKDGIIEHFNKAMMKMAGEKHVTKIIGLNALKLPTYKKAGLTKYFREGLKGKPFRIESVKYISYTGKKTTFRHYNGIPITDENNKVIKLLCIVEDITEKNNIEKSLKEGEYRYHLLVDNVQDQVWVAEIVGISDLFSLLKKGVINLEKIKQKINLKFIYTSPSTKNLRGYTVEEYLKKDMSVLLKPESYQYAMKVLLEEILKEGKKNVNLTRSRTLELEAIRKDGSIYCEEVKMSFIRDEHNMPVSILGVARDVTKRRDDDKKIREKIEQMEFMARTNLKRHKEMLMVKSENQKLKKQLAEYKNKT